MAQLEFMENETIEVMDTQAWMESSKQTIEVQLFVTNIRFIAVQETKEHGKNVICSLNLEEIEQVDHQERSTICWLQGNRFIKFDSDPIGVYLDKIIPRPFG